jgi:hypothetical protein
MQLWPRFTGALGLRTSPLDEAGRVSHPDGAPLARTLMIVSPRVSRRADTLCAHLIATTCDGVSRSLELSL